MKRTCLLTAVLAIACLAACTDVAPLVEESEKNEDRTITVTATIGDATKADYDENGNVTQIKIEHPEDGLISSDEFEYDKYNRIIKHKTINKDFAANALIENIETYTYDQNCRIANTGEKTFFMFK